MNEHTTEGKFDQLKGKVKQTVGEAVGDDRMANSGTADQVKGAAKESWGNTKDAFRDVRDHASTNTADATVAHQNEHNTTAAGHDVRQSVASAAENVKDSIKNVADRIRRSA